MRRPAFAGSSSMNATGRYWRAGLFSSSVDELSAVAGAVDHDAAAAGDLSGEKSPQQAEGEAAGRDDQQQDERIEHEDRARERFEAEGEDEHQHRRHGAESHGAG